MQSKTEQINVRIDRNTAQELRRLVLRKYGKLYGVLRQEIEKGLKSHVQRLEAENDEG